MPLPPPLPPRPSQNGSALVPPPPLPPRSRSPAPAPAPVTTTAPAWSSIDPADDLADLNAAFALSLTSLDEPSSSATSSTSVLYPHPPPKRRLPVQPFQVAKSGVGFAQNETRWVFTFLPDDKFSLKTPWSVSGEDTLVDTNVKCIEWATKRAQMVRDGGVPFSVSVGPDGQYLACAADGELDWGGLPEAVNQELEARRRDKPLLVSLGANGAWVLWDHDQTIHWNFSGWPEYEELEDLLCELVDHRVDVFTLALNPFKAGEFVLATEWPNMELHCSLPKSIGSEVREAFRKARREKLKENMKASHDHGYEMGVNAMRLEQASVVAAPPPVSQASVNATAVAAEEARRAEDARRAQAHRDEMERIKAQEAMLARQRRHDAAVAKHQNDLLMAQAIVNGTNSLMRAQNNAYAAQQNNNTMMGWTLGNSATW